MTFPRLVKIRASWDTLRTSYWFVPTIMSVASVALWVASYTVDVQLGEDATRRLGWIYRGGPDGAREVLAVVSASMITIAGVTFSITIVALTLASQQFGPFLLRNFMRDKGNQIVLGTFISTFIFCLLTLRMIRGIDRETFVPHVSVSMGVLLAMFSLGVLIYFIHHVSALIQASNIISVVGRDLVEAIDRLFPDRLGREEPDEPAQWKVAEDLKAACEEIRSPVFGYVKALDNDLLMKVAKENDVVVRLFKRPGDFVGEDDVIARVWPKNSEIQEVHDAVNDAFVLDNQRTATQDVGFVISQIVEIAVRSLSPGINDPFTAIICIDYLGQGLRRMAGRSIPSPFRRDDEGRLRIIAETETFSELADTALNQIRHYGRSSAAVLSRMLDVITDIAPHVRREEDRQALLRHAERVLEVSRAGLEEKDARWGIRKAYILARASLIADADNPSRISGKLLPPGSTQGEPRG
ncbi:DUF2254 domain-containing protein [Geobacter sp. DSM 9736]|uniref:DUF2254 domain-containing protein n=1 Tax=Geobacter sp. DSM 9736 TaxID=1277350 RepID=UPI000B50D7CF|nr:DUF2254 domain-containing protein [Geobacter sp. DSM 9736]SNB46898.1 Uncharacterized membrane protein [Geobacter sp. DSM 9736]